MKNIIIMLIILNISIFADEQQFEAEIFINKSYKDHKISPFLYRGFLEYDYDFVVGSLGMSSQEIENRGFDLKQFETGLSSLWFRYFGASIPDYEMDSEDMYNPNGVYSQVIINHENENIAGVSQNVYVSNQGSEFYLYMKSEDNLEVFLRITEENDDTKIIFDQLVGKPNNEWNKYSIEIPADLDAFKSKIIIYFKQRGTLKIDEVSLTTKNQKFNIKQEYIDLYKLWNPPIIRFPGGAFADEHAAHWEYGIGDIDMRESPNLFDGRIQKWELGTDDFINFCKYINSEPQLVTNMQYGSPGESAGWVEYCNGAIDTKYGKIRFENGFEEPFNVKYWEIGNEQWHDVIDMSNKFVAHAEEMKKVDDDLIFIMDGNLWGYYDYYKTTVDIAGNYYNIYGWHYLHYVNEKDLGDTNTFYAVMSGAQGSERFIESFRQWRNKAGRFDMDLAVTELWVAYAPLDWFYGKRLFSLENGLWLADQIMQGFENADILKIINRTSNSGLFVRGYNQQGKRVIASTPSLHILSLLKNHSGDYYHETTVTSPTFDIQHEKLSWAEFNVPLLHAATTSSKDSIYIAIVNRDLAQSGLLKFNLDFYESASFKIYQISSDYFLDANSADEPNKIAPIEYEISNLDELIVPKNSFSIIAFDKSILKDTSDLTPENEFKIYPNPTSRALNIENLKTSSNNIKVYDTKGNLLINQDYVDHSNIRIDLEGFAQGRVYIVINNNFNNPHKIMLIK